MTGKVIQPINYRLIYFSNIQNTTANDWCNINQKIVVPDNHFYLCRIWQGWNNGKPVGLGCDKGLSLNSGQGPVMSNESPSSTIYGLIALLDSGTWYIYTKRGSTGLNNYWAQIIDIKYQ